MYLDATIGQSEQCAANLERLATAEPIGPRLKHSPSVPAVLAASSDLIDHARILVKRLRQTGASEKPVEGTSGADKARTIRLVSK
jgi:hypothetical protein